MWNIYQSFAYIQNLISWICEIDLPCSKFDLLGSIQSKGMYISKYKKINKN
jgi:hypothetical protein